MRWVSLLATAGVPHAAIDRADRDDGEGLLVVPCPGAWPAAVARARADARPVVEGPPPARPSEALAVVQSALGALVRPDLRGVLVLRLDDPGGVTGTYLRPWAHPPVPSEAWAALWSNVGEIGRLSVFCSPAWVDEDGALRPSRAAQPDVWAALDQGVASGVADLECHGFTHLHPDRASWARAPDRFESKDWYREMWPPRERVEPSVESQEEIVSAWQAACGRATTIAAPGDRWGPNTIEAARRQGLQLFSSSGVCRLSLPVPTWSEGIGTHPLSEVPERPFAEGLPQVAFWHDRDMALNSPRWAREHITRWREAGATRAWAFADLAKAYGTEIDASVVDGQVVVRQAPDVPLLIEPSATA
jgi:hypothetical protein